MMSVRAGRVAAGLVAVVGLVVGGCSTTPGGLPPVAVISASPVSGVAPLAVGFDSVGSSDPDGSIASYAWEFGDGDTASGAAVSHVYATAGNYTAKLTVTDDSGLTGSVTQLIEVSVPVNQAPVAVADATPKSGNAPLEVDFTSAGSSDPEGQALGFGWDFGDGATSTLADPSHTFSSAGTYTAVLTVTDPDGAFDTAQVEIVVGVNQAPTAAFVATPDSGPRPLVVGLDGSGSDDPDGSIVSWVWDFGDGSPVGSGETTSHTFAASAVPYTVSLTVTDDGGATDTVTHEVSVHVDDDGDGVSPPADCNDADAGIHPGAADPVDGVDQDCDGADGSPVGDAAKITGGDYHTCMIRQNGTLWCWGWNGLGQLGDGTTTNRSTPTQVGGDSDWATITTSGTHSCGTRTNGTAWCWGLNNYGQLGDGTNANRSTPVQVGAGSDWVDIDAGSDFTCGTKTNETVWCWGTNGLGQLGDGTNANRSTPVQVGSDTDWSVISVAIAHTCAIKTNGTAWCWGWNLYGQLGDGTNTDRNIPGQVGTDTNWATLTGGSWHTCGTKTDGTAWCWGRNSHGQLGDGTYTNRLTPVQVGTGTDWVTIDAFSYHNCGTKTDGTAWCWGRNSHGQLGDGTYTNRLTPVQVGAGSDWAAINPGGLFSCGIKTNGTAWCWGGNSYGNLGDGTTTDRITPGPVRE